MGDARSLAYGSYEALMCRALTTCGTLSKAFKKTSLLASHVRNP